MDDRREILSKQIREQTGKYNDDTEPVVLVVKAMRERIEELESQVIKLTDKLRRGSNG